MAAEALRMVADPFDLARFVVAQKSTYDAALSEIQRGAKRGHWMWFVFPQLRGLGHSAPAERFGISSLEEARAYLAHPVLGTRLRECTEAIQDLTGRNAADVFGNVDALKLRSSLTLFTLAQGGPIFEAALARWFGSMDEHTENLIAG